MMNLRSLVTSESTTQNRYGHENIRRGRAASSRRFFTPPSPSGLACRLVLTLAVLLAGVNAAWGDEVVLFENSGSNNQVSIGANTIKENFPTIESTTVFRIYTEDKGLANISGWNAAILASGSKIIPAGSSYYNRDLSCYEIPLSDFKDNFPYCLALDNGEPISLQVGQWDQQSITKVSVATPDAVVDAFLNIAADGYAPTSNAPGEEISRELSSKEINLSGASLAGVEYVRVYLANDKGKAVDPTGLLSVKYGGTDATRAGTEAKNGFYLYNNGSDLTLSNIQVTLNAGAGNFTKYKIVALLSNDLSTATISAGSIGKEPKWQEEYTYTFTYPIYKKTFEIDDTYLSASEIVIDKKIDTDTGTGADDKYYHDLIETHYGLSLSGDAGDKALAGKWYGRWYVLNPSGQEQPLQLVSPTSEKWGVAPRRNGEKWEDYGWSISGNIVYTNNNARSNDWFVKDALCRAKISAPTGKTLDEFSGYKIVFECTNDYTSGDPEMNLRYTFEIPFTSFPGDGKTGSATDGGTQMLTDRTVASVEVDLNTMAFAHTKVSDDDIRYARFYLANLEGTPIAPGELLSVSYDGATATLCSPAKLGFYVYNGGNKLDKSKFKVMLKAPSQYKKYKVVAVLANNPLANHVPNDGSAPLTEEPDWDLTYTYSFGYTVTTQEKSGNISWKKNTGMPADASVSDPLTEWGTTWDDLSSAQYVNWYVVDGDNTPQEIALGSSRQSGKWSIGLNSPFIEAADGKSVVLTGQNSFTSANWNGTWGKPSLYAPAGQTFADIQNFKVICEVREEADANATPNVRYTFSFVKEFLGELKDDGKEGGETIDVANTTTSETLSLGSAIAAWNSKSPGHTSAKYARVWLTNGSTLIEPSGKLTASGMSAFAHHDTKYGFFVAVDGGVSLSNVTLTLAAGTFNNYTVHVALSTDYPDNTTAFARRQTGTRAGEGVYEPDYDFHYTFNFKYPVKTKYKTLIYDPSTGQTSRTQLFTNWYEPVADCNSNRQHMASNGYARWYLIDKTTGNRIQMKAFSSDQTYHNLGNDYGYWRYKFDAGNFRDGYGVTSSGGDYTGYDPVVTLPDAYKESYRNVRLICVVTTLTDETAGELEAGTITNEPEEMQVKYVYDLRTEAELQAQPFVHYHGVHYPQYHRSFEDSREFVGPEQIYGIQSLPETGTAVSGLTQLVWDYGKNDLYNPADNTYEANRKPQASPDYATRNIRQKTHTKVFDYYVKPGAQEVLELPFQYYDGEGHYEIVLDNGVAKVAKSYSGDGPLESVGSDTEPMGYIRWYDWKTDKASSAIVKDNAKEKNQLTDLPGGRGLYKTMINGNPTKDLIGVLFNAPADFNEEYLIACDVSRYMDGMDESKTYMLHEPTLSMRYIFRIHPAKEKAKEIEDASANFINQAEQMAAGTLENKTLPYSDLLEYSGRTVVALDADGDGHFSMRTQNTRLEHYFVDSSDPKACDYMQWYAFYEDGKDVYRFKVTMDKMWNDDKYAGTNSQLRYNTFPDTKNGTTRDVKIESDQRGKRRLAVFELDDFVGEYTSLDGSKTKNLTRGDIRSLYVVGYLGNTASGIEKPVSAAELLFRRTPPQLIGTESEDRKQNFLSEEYDEKAVLDFNDFFDDESTRFSNPTVAFENYAKIPMVFANAQYGFCYPRLYGQEATNWKIHHGGYWEGYGVGPLHGDYTLLKSMNVEGISETRIGDNNSSEALNNESLYTLWYLKDKLYDVMPTIQVSMEPSSTLMLLIRRVLLACWSLTPRSVKTHRYSLQPIWQT